MDIKHYKSLKPYSESYVTAKVSSMSFSDMSMEIDLGKGAVGSYYLAEGVKDNISRIVGVSPSLKKGLYSIDPTLWYDVISKLYKYYYNENLTLLVHDTTVVGVTTSSVIPTLNREFVDATIEYIDTLPDVDIEDININKDDLTSSIIVTYNKKYDSTIGEYKIGMYLYNDELNGVSANLLTKLDNGTVIVLPSKFYSSSSNRYVKNSNSSLEAYRLLLIKVCDDMVNNLLDERSKFITNKLDGLASIPITLEEYRNIRTSLNNSAYNSDIDESEVQSIISELDTLNDFETLYDLTKEQQYIFRCTAVSDKNLLDYTNVLSNILTNHVFYTEPSRALMMLLGELVFNPRLSSLIARRF